jgi:ABC-type transporter Mla subunit MlaD
VLQVINNLMGEQLNRQSGELLDLVQIEMDRKLSQGSAEVQQRFAELKEGIAEATRELVGKLTTLAAEVQDREREVKRRLAQTEGTAASLQGAFEGHEERLTSLLNKLSDLESQVERLDASARLALIKERMVTVASQEALTTIASRFDAVAERCLLLECTAEQGRKTAEELRSRLAALENRTPLQIVRDALSAWKGNVVARLRRHDAIASASPAAWR